jgi:hypothetical protein
MSMTAFNKELDTFCRTYMFSDRPVSLTDNVAFPSRAKLLDRTIFEQLLIFDSVAFKVSGENVPLAMLISRIGLKGVEKLLEEDALKFVLWQQDVFSLVDPVDGVHPLASGNLSSETHADPEKSIEVGLGFLTNPIPPMRRKRLVQKILPHYVQQPEGLAVGAVAASQQAYTAGRLAKHGLSSELGSLEKFPKDKIPQLRDCAVEILEYTMLMKNGWSSINNFTYFDLFSESVKNLTSAAGMKAGFQHLVTLNEIPDFPGLFEKIDAPLNSIPRIRSKRSSVKFRHWLEKCEGDTPDELSRRYIAAIGEGKGFSRGGGKIRENDRYVRRGRKCRDSDRSQPCQRCHWRIRRKNARTACRLGSRPS